MDQQVLTCMLHSLLCASSCPKHVNILILFSSYNNPVLQSLYYEWENCSTKRVSNVFKVTQLVSLDSDLGSVLWESLL